jgi:hypothetical protein
MKKISILFMVAVLGVGLWSCEKDETKTVFNLTPAFTLTAPTSAQTFVMDTSVFDNVFTVSWNAASFGFPADITYQIELANAGSNFAKTVILGGTSSSGQTFSTTWEELNNKVLFNLGNLPDTASMVEMRVVASVSEFADKAYSNVVTLTVTPFLSVPSYDALYLPGAYQGWSPPLADSIVDVKSDKTFKGFVNIGSGTLFKFTDFRDWIDPNNYGTGGPGKLSPTGDNLDLESQGAGFYEFKADLNELTWSYRKTTSWGVVGSATPGGWDTDTPLVLESSDYPKIWTATVNLVPGELKFRADGAWDFNFGDSPKADGVVEPVGPSLDEGGDNIQVTSAGTYLIILDFSQKFGYYRYDLKKL